MAAELTSASLVALITTAWSNAGPPSVKSQQARGQSKQFTIGTGINSANKWTTKSYSIAASGGQDIDFNALTDPEGTAVSFTKVRGLIVELPSGVSSATSIRVGPADAGSNPISSMTKATTDAVIVANGGCALLFNPTAAGYAISGSAKVLHITNLDGSNSATVYVTILGE